MSRTLVLMRHGKAVQPKSDQPDAERKLTGYGVRALQATLPDALSVLPQGATVQVWTSPAQRACQTARIVHRACKKAGIRVSAQVETVDALWDQDFDALAELLAACQADLVFAVGHNPFVEGVVEDLTGARIDFATGAFAAIALPARSSLGASHKDNSLQEDAAAATEVETKTATKTKAAAKAEDEAENEAKAEGEAVNEAKAEAGSKTAAKATDAAKTAGEGTDETEAESEIAPYDTFYTTTYPARLLWFQQGPLSQRWKTLSTMEHVIEDAAQAVQTRLEGFFANPEDPETMHKFRVSIRTLRSLLAFVRPWQQPEQNGKCQENLKRIVGTTSRLRELDVLADQASEFDGCSAELAAFCAQQATAERNRVIKTLSSNRTKKLLDSTIAALGKIVWRKRVEGVGLDAAEVRVRFDKLTASLQQALDSLDLADEIATHDVRKDAKRVRYDAEQFKSLLGEDAVGIAKGMIAHQDNLGAICDARSNIRIIADFEAGKLPEQVAWELALLRAQNETFLYTTLRAQ